MNTKQLIDAVKRIESILDETFNATGSNFRDKIVTTANQMPKGIVEKLNYLAGLYERAQTGEKLSADELKQAGFFVNAIEPYVTNGARRSTHWVSRIVWLILAALAVFVAYKLLS